MLRFSLFGFPVRIEWFFWVLCLILGMRYLDSGRGGGGPEGIGMFLIASAIVLVSILWHELGHAWARKKYGAPFSEIVLHGFGGVCSGPGHFTRGQSIFISAAGPIASLFLGFVVWLVREAYPPSSFFAFESIRLLLWVNIGWAIINLFPIYPLDGGQIFAGIMGPRRLHTVLWVGIVLAAILAIYAYVSWGSLFGAILFGMLAWGNWQRLQGKRSNFM